jgi:hypothetical protein
MRKKTKEELIAIGFGNILDFARFEPDGSVHIFDWQKAREVGAKVSVTTRKVGRGKNARTVRTTEIKMPENKVTALIELIRRLEKSEPEIRKR